MRKKTLDGINAINKFNIPIRINTVVGKRNIREIPEIIRFCNESGLELKLFDITYHHENNSPHKNFWKEHYASLMPIYKKLNKKCGKAVIGSTVGGYGNPLFIFKSKSPIIIQTSEIAAFYHANCRRCQNYPCQNGFSNITLSADGILRPCKYENSLFEIKLTDHCSRPLIKNEIQQRFRHLITLFQQTRQIGRRLKNPTNRHLVASKTIKN